MGGASDDKHRAKKTRGSWSSTGPAAVFRGFSLSSDNTFRNNRNQAVAALEQC